MKYYKKLRKLFLKRDIWTSKTTDKTKILDFLSAVKPLEVNYELIRLGGNIDGGYLVPDDLEGIEFCFSPGVSEVATFEEDLTKRGVKCFLADYSVDAPPIKDNLFDFEKKYIGTSEFDVFMTLEYWINEKAPGKSDFILQMDIEGAEYGVVLETSPETLKKFRIIVVEFHGLDAILDSGCYEFISLTFAKILRDFEVVHIHPNNRSEPIVWRDIKIPPIMEFTFLRKDRINTRIPALSFPHKLDKTNVPSVKDFALPNCWYRTN